MVNLATGFTDADNLEAKGFYTAINHRIVCFALKPDGGSEELMSVGAPPCPEGGSFIFRDNVQAGATLIHPDGDAFALLARFQAKCPLQFAEKQITALMSLEK